MKNKIIILGAGMTGLAAGLASGSPIYEAEEKPGGICSSYYVYPGDNKRLKNAPADGEAYRFEIGGGHWIFGDNPSILRLIKNLLPVKQYKRRSKIYFPKYNLFVPYPLQNNLRYLEKNIAIKAISEIFHGLHSSVEVNTLKEWLEKNFGVTLCELFFFPFHELYTAGLFNHVAPQDLYKSPINLKLVIQGALNSVPDVGYNTTFVYPIGGLNLFSELLAAKCDVHYNKRAVSIDIKKKIVYFEDGLQKKYNTLISTLPLSQMIEITGLDSKIETRKDPSTAVLVVNIGAIRGHNCPNDHWIYISDSKVGFHRVGFYSNVDLSFIPSSKRESHNYISLYVEKSYPYNMQVSDYEMKSEGEKIVAELQEWGWIEDVEVIDPTFINIAYTWSWPFSSWKKDALHILEKNDILQVGRYAQWEFKGISDSLREGLYVGSALKI